MNATKQITKALVNDKDKATMPNKAVKIIPSASDNSPLANGLSLVLSTSRSYLWSRRSLNYTAK